MIRSRVQRRAQLRRDAKELRAIHSELAARGLAERAVSANRVIAPGAAFFWHALKARIAARESLRELTSLDQVRDIALGLLAEEGVDMTGLVLKVEWRPPVLQLEAVPSQGDALAAVEAVRSRPKVRRRPVGQMIGG